MKIDQGSHIILVDEEYEVRDTDNQCLQLVCICLQVGFVDYHVQPMYHNGLFNIFLWSNEMVRIIVERVCSQDQVTCKNV